MTPTRFYDDWSEALIPWVARTEACIRDVVSVRSPNALESVDPQLASDLRSLPDVANDFAAWMMALRMAVFAASERGTVRSDRRAHDLFRALDMLMFEAGMYWVSEHQNGFRDLVTKHLVLSDEIMLYLEQCGHSEESTELVGEFREFRREFVKNWKE